jgi:hypothetical protein
MRKFLSLYQTLLIDCDVFVLDPEALRDGIFLQNRGIQIPSILDLSKKFKILYFHRICLTSF